MDDENLFYRRIVSGETGEDEILHILAKNLGYEVVDLRQLESESAFTPKLLAAIPAAHAERHRVFPVRVTEDTLWVALADPLNIDATDQLERLCGKRVVPVLEHEVMIVAMIRKYYHV